ncbi:MAG: hypothetical protein RIC06_00985 [Cyclobacteriaceae bacterium]
MIRQILAFLTIIFLVAQCQTKSTSPTRKANEGLTNYMTTQSRIKSFPVYLTQDYSNPGKVQLGLKRLSVN